MANPGCNGGRRTFFTLGVLGAVSGSPLAAQTARGVVLDSTGSKPLLASVQLMSPDGKLVGCTPG